MISLRRYIIHKILLTYLEGTVFLSTRCTGIWFNQIKLLIWNLSTDGCSLIASYSIKNGQKYYLSNMNINVIKLSRISVFHTDLLSLLYHFKSHYYYYDVQVISLKYTTYHSAPVEVQVIRSNSVTLLIWSRVDTLPNKLRRHIHVYSKLSQYYAIMHINLQINATLSAI